MDRSKLRGLFGAVVAFIVIGFAAIQGFYYMYGFSPSSNVLTHQFLLAVSFLFSVVGASYVYNLINGREKSSFYFDEDGNDKY